MSISGTTPPMSFAHDLESGHYFVTTNPYGNAVILDIRLTKYEVVKLKSGIVKLSNDGVKYEKFIFEDLQFSPPTNPNCGFAKLLGCNNFYRYTAELRLGKNSTINIPQKIGDKIWIIPPQIIYDDKVIKLETVVFENKKKYWLTPLL
ncbi:hypothetical protein [Aliikangiella coralliicola]|uniref:Uncharacterized protein n=1 Tax=Aliikangiella coralliicola TaxID=2592383 RepID=A0A545UH84_9GAMM|nr:hypothetical protein [Aliikangiella coralliicola]TQV88831.1 hypothetical protein FLL46_04675 [Aliikangiella coralliicola]